MNVISGTNRLVVKHLMLQPKGFQLVSRANLAFIS